MISLAEANAHIGDMVLQRHGTHGGTGQKVPARLIGVRRGKALVLPPGHKRGELAELESLEWWKKGNHDQAKHTAAHKRDDIKPDDIIPSPIDQRVVHLKGTRLFFKGGGFTEQLHEAKVYGRDEDAKRAVTRIARFSTDNVKRPVADMSIMSMANAKLEVKRWAAEPVDITKSETEEIAKPDVCIEPELLVVDPPSAPTVLRIVEPALPVEVVTKMSEPKPVEAVKLTHSEALSAWILARRSRADYDGLVIDAQCEALRSKKDEDRLWCELEIARVLEGK